MTVTEQPPTTTAATPPHDVAAISARQVAVVYGRGANAVVALEGMELEVGRNEFVSLIGPSGCGKSTLLKAVADLVPSNYVQGSLLVEGVSPAEARKRNTFAFVFQDPVLAPWRSVIQNINLPLEIVDAQKFGGGRSPQDLVELVGLQGFESALPDALSGGMRQRVAIARALTLDPSVLLMDEPFGALDELTRDRMQDELLNIWNSTTASVLLVTHSIPEAVYLSDRVVVMTDRPGRSTGILDIPFERPRRAELKRTVEFLEKENQVREMLGL